MSDPIDRVFVKAITTIRALLLRLNYGTLPRPPAENRIKLYGLYKQAIEGNVDGIMERPTGHTLEDEGAKKKWDAWKREQGLSRTEAKRQYIAYLIDTMRVYASSTTEARELLLELEYLWEQIKDVQFEEEEWPQRMPVANVDQLDRMLTGTGWYAPLVSNQQYRHNLQQIYSHSRRNTQMSLTDLTPRAGPALVSAYSVPAGAGPRSREVPASALDDFRAWQGEINSVVNKLSKEYLGRNRQPVPSDSELELDDRQRLVRRALVVLRTIGAHAAKILKNLAFSSLAILFLVWCIKKNVVVRRTVVRLLDSHRELVVNMVMNPDENKWFVRLLTLINGFVGFV